MSNSATDATQDRFFVKLARAGKIDEGARKLLLDTVRNSSTRLPRASRASIVAKKDEDDRLSDTPASIFIRQLIDLFLQASEALTAVLEYDHIDPTYRDMYYRHYSHEFFDVNRFSLRVNFFAKAISQEEFITSECGVLQDVFIGSCVIGSLDGYGSVGRTLLNPAFLIKKHIDVRLSTFCLNICGRSLTVNAFPYRGQDGAMMRCAEVTLLNLMCYYSNEYSDYHLTLPSEIIAHEQLYSSERVIPSRGLSYDNLTRILSDFRFFPRLYNIDSIGSSVNLGVELPKEVLFRRLLHWYVGSGIPVAINVGKARTDDDGHSVICIGYEDPRVLSCATEDERVRGDSGRQHVFMSPQVADHSIRVIGRKNGKERRKESPAWEGTYSFQLVCGADFDRDFVIIDDGMAPYAVMPYSQPSHIPGFECLNYAVALHRGMAMDAMDAYENAILAIGHPEFGVMTWGSRYLKGEETLVFDMFMASVRGYKRDRINHERNRYHELKDTEGQNPERYNADSEKDANPNDPTEAEWHGIIAHALGIFALPHFLWVVEISLPSEYSKPQERRRVFAELVFDATSGGAGDVIDKIVLMRYPDKIYMRSPDGMSKIMPVGIGNIDRKQIRPYGDNLARVAPIKRQQQS